MQRSFDVEFRTHAIVTDVTGNIPRWCGNCLTYAQAERFIFQEGISVRQFYSHYLFFVEIMDIDLHTELVSDFVIKKASLFLFMMLEGNMSYCTAAGDPIAEATGNTCYATYNREGRFTFSLPAGKHRLCYILPRTEWIAKNIKHYPRLEPFLENMYNSETPNGYLPTCTITRGMEKGLKKLFELREEKGRDFEADLLRDAKRVMFHYQNLLDDKLAQRVHLIKDYIDSNYADPELNNALLMKVFHITGKTLIDTFKAEFGTTPYNYLVEFRIEKARLMFEKREKTPSQVYILIGYVNFRSFKTQFKKIHGISPSQYYKLKF